MPERPQRVPLCPFHFYLSCILNILFSISKVFLFGISNVFIFSVCNLYFGTSNLLSLLLTIIYDQGGATTFCHSFANLSDVETSVWTELRLFNPFQVQSLQEDTGGR